MKKFLPLVLAVTFLVPGFPVAVTSAKETEKVDRCGVQLRSDGLGNRFEQMMNIGTNSMFYWPATSNGRGDTYAGLSTYITFQGSVLREGEAPRGLAPCPSTKHDRAKTARLLRPAFNISFGDLVGVCSPIGVHIRAGDRIESHGSISDFSTKEEITRSMQLTAKALNHERPHAIFIASEGSSALVYHQKFLKLLDPSIQVVNPNSTGGVQPLIDFFALSLCREVWMASRFSSFAIMAASVGGVPLRSMLHPQVSNLKRYAVDVKSMPTQFSWEPGTIDSGGLQQCATLLAHDVSKRNETTRHVKMNKHTSSSWKPDQLLHLFRPPPKKSKRGVE